MNRFVVLALSCMSLGCDTNKSLDQVQSARVSVAYFDSPLVLPEDCKISPLGEKHGPKIALISCNVGDPPDIMSIYLVRGQCAPWQSRNVTTISEEQRKGIRSREMRALLPSNLRSPDSQPFHIRQVWNDIFCIEVISPSLVHLDRFLEPVWP